MNRIYVLGSKNISANGKLEYLENKIANMLTDLNENKMNRIERNEG